FLLLSPQAAIGAQDNPVTGKTESPKAKTGKTKKNAPAKKVQAAPTSELAKLREEFIKATYDYKASLGKLRETYEKSLAKAEAELTKSRELFAAGLISRKMVEDSELAVAHEKKKLAEVDQ